ncbi:MAG TPA: DUF2254 domain-containing protein [Ilumatobacteraceae bacterium]|nr:DUF2254 domain-containing protein [Ilumatobacteraceae bacterium]
MSSALSRWGATLSKSFGLVRLRQIVDQIRHRLSFVPMMYVAGAIVVGLIMLWIDRQLSDQDLPDILLTTVPSGRSVFSAIAAGLITSVTLLLSMMLVAVQLASSQFSPRSLRGWLGNRTLQHAVGLALGTTVFCLLALRSTRDFDEDGEAVIPHVTVLVAMALGVASLIAVVRTVDHVTDSLRVGSVITRVAGETTGVSWSEGRRGASLGSADVSIPDGDSHHPAGSTPIEAPAAGWVQQIDEGSILQALPAGGTAWLTVQIGSFVPCHAPLLWVDPPLGDDDEKVVGQLTGCFAIGDTRTMQQDVGFGIVQLVDIAVRAMSPGINDPATATDVIAQVGDVLIVLWSQPPPARANSDDDRTVVRRPVFHGDHLDHFVRSLCRYASDDVDVLRVLQRTIHLVRDEVLRRGLPGPLAPLDDALATVQDAIDRTQRTT